MYYDEVKDFIQIIFFKLFKTNGKLKQKQILIMKYQNQAHS